MTSMQPAASAQPRHADDGAGARTAPTSRLMPSRWALRG